jgi:hypothetical protein
MLLKKPIDTFGEVISTTSKNHNLLIQHLNNTNFSMLESFLKWWQNSQKNCHCNNSNLCQQLKATVLGKPTAML